MISRDLKNQVIKTSVQPKQSYSQFSKINGEHPFKKNIPEARVEYQARLKKGGKVAFFNYDLATEMGLIDKNHFHSLNPELEQVIMETFGLVIINEYDIENNLSFPKEEIKPHTYMATRYLQIQHPDKSGRTSGDGRTIWNGAFRGNGTTWDISSCGTGATKLSPAANIYKKNFQTGDPTISYGCGLSELSEGLETLFFSEIFNQNNIRTERLLAVIEYEKGLSINVRAYPNLLRPSHFFCHLKQGNYKTLKEIADYYIQRQIDNKEWSKSTFKNEAEKYHYFLEKVSERFAETVADFEDHYIFCWLDWDGDNILMDGGIIDYGSIRQFGLFHSEYRYDDVERYSTTILEQKAKAKYIVQTFAQIVDFLITKNKKNISMFKNHHVLKQFDKTFEKRKDVNLLKKIGLKTSYRDFVLNNHSLTLREFRKAFTYFERAKSERGMYKVADGITRDAIFCMRDILREFPQIILSRKVLLEPNEFLEIIKSSYAKKSDLKVTSLRQRQILKFQKNYLKMIDLITHSFKESKEKILLDITMRSSVINKYDRVTGDSITHVVQKVMRSRPKLSPQEIYLLVKEFSQYQNLDPEAKQEQKQQEPRQIQMMKGIYTIVRECREGL